MELVVSMTKRLKGHNLEKTAVPETNTTSVQGGDNSELMLEEMSANISAIEPREVTELNFLADSPFDLLNYDTQLSLLMKKFGEENTGLKSQYLILKEKYKMLYEGTRRLIIEVVGLKNSLESIKSSLVSTVKKDDGIIFTLCLGILKSIIRTLFEFTKCKEKRRDKMLMSDREQIEVLAIDEARTNCEI